jgi:hypothetical protein
MEKLYTSEDLKSFKQWKKEINLLFQELKKSALYKNMTVTYWNKNMSKFTGMELADICKDLEENLHWLGNAGFNGAFERKSYEFTGTNARTLSARGWHKDHYNYNKAEKHERTPALRRTPARNVTRTGAKRKRATSIKKYKR